MGYVSLVFLRGSGIGVLAIIDSSSSSGVLEGFFVQNFIIDGGVRSERCGGRDCASRNWRDKQNSRDREGQGWVTKLWCGDRDKYDNGMRHYESSRVGSGGVWERGNIQP